MQTLVKPQGCTNLKLRQLMRLVARHFDAEVGKSGLRGTQYSLLSYVVKLGPVGLGELARTMRIEPSTLSRNLLPLQAAGWVEVGPGADGRSKRVQATDSGRAKRQEAQRRWRVAQEGINDLLGTETVVALHALLDAASERMVMALGNDGAEDAAE